MQTALIKYNLALKDQLINVGDEVKAKDTIVIETTRGILLAKVVSIVGQSKELEQDVKYVRVATDADITKDRELQEKAKANMEVVDRLIAKNNIDMKPVSCEYTLDGSKIIISFVCEGRVDFRELVKDLAGELKVRIELRQIGIRDQAKSIGCMGICGKECCCKQYLNDFDKVSIKMAKTQNLSLNPTKISGTCGRLMCCLAYENDTYEDLGRNCCKCGARVRTPDGEGSVISNNILKQTCTCKVEKGDDVKYCEYPVSDIKEIKIQKRIE